MRCDTKPLVESTFCGFGQVSQTPDKPLQGGGRRFQVFNVGVEIANTQWACGMS